MCLIVSITFGNPHKKSQFLITMQLRNLVILYWTSKKSSTISQKRKTECCSERNVVNTRRRRASKDVNIEIHFILISWYLLE